MCVCERVRVRVCMQLIKSVCKRERGRGAGGGGGGRMRTCVHENQRSAQTSAHMCVSLWFSSVYLRKEKAVE